VTVDPRLFVPDGVIDLKKTTPETDTENPGDVLDNLDVLDGDTTDSAAVLYDTVDTAASVGAENDMLPTPQGFVVVLQTVRFAPDGRAVVDVVVEVEDVPGITNYELRVNKA
jgi:hypothetical protein